MDRQTDAFNLFVLNLAKSLKLMTIFGYKESKVPLGRTLFIICPSVSHTCRHLQPMAFSAECGSFDIPYIGNFSHGFNFC